MSYSGSTPLVQAKGFGGLPERVEREAGERVPFDIFEKEKLPLALREAPNMLMPLHSMASLFARGADALDCRTFGLDIGEQMTHP